MGLSGTNLIESLAGLKAGSQLAEVASERSGIMEMSQASHDAVLLPREPGGLSHAERAALAVRMARWNGDSGLAAHYRELLGQAGETSVLAAIASGAALEQLGADARLIAITRHVDILTKTVKDATRADIEALKAAGIAEPDIVRLAELAAFVNYQVRVIAGLRLLEEVL